jgi:hypothetical protein
MPAAQDTFDPAEKQLDVIPTVCPAHNSANILSYQELPMGISQQQGHGLEAKIGSAGGTSHRTDFEALGAFLLPCAAPGVSLLALWYRIDAPPRGQPWTPAVTLPHDATC